MDSPQELKPKWALVTDYPQHWGKVPSQTTIAEICIQRTPQMGSQSMTPYISFHPHALAGQNERRTLCQLIRMRKPENGM